LLGHIFTNLLTNAIKYSDVGQLMRFEIGCAGAEMVSVIRDQGIGIPEADREWLFNAFDRGHNVADRPGTGLGLVIVKRCVDLHGGKIKVESRFGEGTAVTVRLPILSKVSPERITHTLAFSVSFGGMEQNGDAGSIQLVKQLAPGWDRRLQNLFEPIGRQATNSSSKATNSSSSPSTTRVSRDQRLAPLMSIT
jgi:hypothetical protein